MNSSTPKGDKGSIIIGKDSDPGLREFIEKRRNRNFAKMSCNPVVLLLTPLEDGEVEQETKEAHHLHSVVCPVPHRLVGEKFDDFLLEAFLAGIWHFQVQVVFAEDALLRLSARK